MSARPKGPRLYLDSKRRQWIIRHGQRFVRTGCLEGDVQGAEESLHQYLAQNRQPAPSSSPLIADVLLVYLREHAVHTRSLRTITQTVTNLEPFWGDKRLTDITAKSCRAYAASRPPVAARRDLQTLRAAINYWHREYGPLPSVPFVILPANPAPRERWLTRSEVARLLRAARHCQHLRRFILLGIYTGTRPGAILVLTWDRIDFAQGVMHRRAEGETESKKRRPPVRLGRKILGHLHRWRRIDGNTNGIICHYNGKKVRDFRTSWPKAVKRAGLEGHVIPHTLRHTRATWLMQSGVPVWEAAGQLGMSPQVLEKTYGHWHFGKRAAEV
jgi:integrase